MLNTKKTNLALLNVAALLLLPACGPGESAAPIAEPSAAAAEKLGPPVGDPVAGQALYTTCKTCHGENGHGMLSLNAPSLVNQEPWYLTRQLLNFKKGIRGTNPGNPFALQMAPMMQTLPDEQAVADVVAYIKTLQPGKVAKTLEGDVESGREYYNMICGACHGNGGVGNEALNSPRLTGMDDWYMLRQLEHFQQGIRGTHPEDALGAQMKLIASAIPEKKLMNDVIAYLQSLQDDDAAHE